MPPYLNHLATYEALWPLPLLCATIALIFYPFVRRSKDAAASLAAIFTLGMLGVVSGILTGISRESAVAAVLPSVLSLVGLLVLYIVGAQKGESRTVCACVVALVFNLVVGTFWGSVLREVSEREEFVISYGESAQLERADSEVRVRKYRFLLGLPVEDSMASESKRLYWEKK